jgi:hypothetical protein
MPSLCNAGRPPLLVSVLPSSEACSFSPPPLSEPSFCPPRRAEGGGGSNGDASHSPPGTIVRTMRVALTFALLLAMTFGLTAGALACIAVHDAGYHCSCPIKGPCCKGPVCRMEAARQHAGGLRLQTCGQSREQELPPLARWLGVMPATIEALAASHAPRSLLRARDAVSAAGFAQLPDHPPRPLLRSVTV